MVWKDVLQISCLSTLQPKLAIIKIAGETTFKVEGAIRPLVEVDGQERSTDLGIERNLSAKLILGTPSIDKEYLKIQTNR